MPADTHPNLLHHAETRALRWATGLFVLTSVHHVYGAIVYHTPARYHAAVIAGVAVAGMAAALRASRKSGAGTAREAAWWTFWTVGAVVFVALFGLVEGAYNHLLKNVLFLGGLPLARMRVLFPAPIYEMPDDAFFEITGVLQVLPAVFEAFWLAALLRLRRGAQGCGPTSRGSSKRAEAPTMSAGGAAASRPAPREEGRVPGLATRIAHLTVRVTGPVQVVLGLLFWLGYARGLLVVHMLVGLLFTLALLVLTGLAARAGLRVSLVAASGGLVVLLPAFGVVQAQIWPGEWHWLVRAAHLGVGFVGMAVAARLVGFMRSRSAGESGRSPRAAR